MAGWMTLEALNKGYRTLFFVHRHELIDQTSETFSALGIDHGIIAAGSPKEYDKPVQIASVQTLTRRLSKVPAPDFMICDECHHILAKSYMKILTKWDKAYLLGLTATPLRMGGIRLGDVFTSMVRGPSVTDLINGGNLSHFRYVAPTENLDLSSVRVRYGEYDNHDLEAVMSGKDIVGNIVDNYVKYINNKSAIVYCVNVKHSAAVAEHFNERGVIAAHCDGGTPKDVRNQMVADFKAGNIKVLCNAELFGEGFDVPAMQAVILARPTMSLTLFVQQSMRALRIDPDDPNKVAVIIDHVNNYQRFGLPDSYRKWSLDPNEQDEDEDEEEAYKRCPVCGEVLAYNVRTCPACGFVFVSIPRPKKIQQREGDLGEIYSSDENQSNQVESAADRVIHKPTTIEEFVEIAKQRKYKIGWAAIQAIRYAQSYEDCLHIAECCCYHPGWADHIWRELCERRENEKNSRPEYRQMTLPLV